jgi:hypothetical protein
MTLCLSSPHGEQRGDLVVRRDDVVVAVDVDDARLVVLHLLAVYCA